MEKAEGFDVTEYGEHDDTVDRRSAILTIIKRLERESPAIGVHVKFMGDDMQLTYHTYEMHVPSKMKYVEDRANGVLDDVLKQLKKEYKADVGKALSLKEKKERASHSVQKVSMSERYYAVFWRVYEIR